MHTSYVYKHLWVVAIMMVCCSMLTIFLSVLRTFHLRRHRQPIARAQWENEQAPAFDDPRMEEFIRRIIHSTIDETRKGYEDPDQASVRRSHHTNFEPSMARPVSKVETAANWSGCSRSLTLEERSVQTRSHMHSEAAR